MSKNVVVDASVALSWLLPGEETKHTLSLRDYAAANSEVSLYVPPIFWDEIANVLWVAVKRERITQPQAIDGIKALQEFQFHIRMTDPVDNIAISFTQDISVYDAAYLNVARHHKAVLWTIDERLVQAAKNLYVFVIPER